MRPEVQVLPGPQTIEASGRELARVSEPIELSNIRRFVESPGRTTASQTARRTEVAGAQVRGARRIGGRRVRRRPQAEKCAGRCCPLARGNLDPLSASLAASPAGCGDVAQVVEHRLCKAGVRGSSPLVSTHQRPCIPWPVALRRFTSRSTTARRGHTGDTPAARGNVKRVGDLVEPIVEQVAVQVECHGR
jgi:hypothetical protein